MERLAARRAARRAGAAGPGAPPAAGAPPPRPALLLAPMELLGDRAFRRAHALAAGGVDEYCTEFLRVPDRGPPPSPRLVRGLVGKYDPGELEGRAPLAVQVMGASPERLAAVVGALVARGAGRVDLNCGCPANTVTGKGAGSSLLRDPLRVEACVTAMVEAAEGRVPISVKMRSGFESVALFEDNARAVQAGGAAFCSVHPRTKRQGYRGRADWSLIALAARLLDIPVVGNGDVTSAGAALALLRETGCDGVMVGRGAVSDPFIFHRITAALAAEEEGGDGDRGEGGEGPAGEADGEDFGPEAVCRFVEAFHRELLMTRRGLDHLGSKVELRSRVGRLKQVSKYLLAGAPSLRPLITIPSGDVSPEEYLARLQDALRAEWPAALAQAAQVNEFSHDNRVRSLA